MSLAYIQGWHGRMNFGDDIFTEILSWGLQEYGGLSGIVLGADRHGQYLGRSDIHSLAPRWRIPGLTRLNHWRYRQRITHFVLGGGSTLQNADYLLSDRGGMQARCRKLAIGISAGPFDDSRAERQVAEYLKGFEFVSFRDDRSFEWGVNNGLAHNSHKAFDMAVLAERVGLTEGSHANARNRSGSASLGVSILSEHQFSKQKSSQSEFHNLIEGVSGVCNERWGDSSFKLLNLCDNAEYSDARSSKRLASELRSSYLETHTHDGCVRKTLSHFKDCSHIISMRLHGSVMALTLGIPFLVLSYHKKCEDFARSIGLDERLIVPAHPFDAARFDAAVEYLLTLDQPPIQIPMKTLGQRALLNFNSIPNNDFK